MTLKRITYISFFSGTFAILIFGLYLTSFNGYGSDNDTYGILRAYLHIINTGQYSASRFTGNPVAEIFIGSVSYYFGSQTIKILIFLFFVLGIFLFYYSFDKQVFSIKFAGFLFLCLSSPVLFFDNLEPMEYSIAFFFFSLGLIFRSYDLRILMMLSFAFSVGTRISFILFALVILLFDNKVDKKNKASELFTLIIISALFYVPIWIRDKLTFEWLGAKQPDEQGILGIIARFGYKSWLSVGLISLLIVLYILIQNRRKILNNYNHKIIILLITANLAIYFWIPADRSYLQPALIFTYYLISNYAKTLFIFILVLLNFQTWVFSFSIFQFTFENSDPCAPILATAVQIDPNINFDGELRNFFTQGDLSYCFLGRFEKEVAESISNGSSLKS